MVVVVQVVLAVWNGNTSVSQGNRSGSGGFAAGAGGGSSVDGHTPPDAGDYGGAGGSISTGGELVGAAVLELIGAGHLAGQAVALV